MASISWISVSCLRLGKFSAIRSSNMFSSPFSLFSFWDPYIANISMLDVVLEVSKVSSFPFILFSVKLQ